MSPITFLKRPVRWLEAIDRYRATVTVAPNFSYELLARRVSDDDLARLDLSSAPGGAQRRRADSRPYPRCGDHPAGSRGFPARRVRRRLRDGRGDAAGQRERGRAAPPRYLDVDPDALERHEVVPGDAGGATRLVGNGPPAGHGPADRGRRRRAGSCRTPTSARSGCVGRASRPGISTGTRRTPSGSTRAPPTARDPSCAPAISARCTTASSTSPGG